MKKKQMLAMLLAALMTFSVPLVAFATQPTAETDSQTEVTPYLQPDTTPPVLRNITVDKNKQEVKPGDVITITLDAVDNSSGITSSMVGFWNNSGVSRGISGEGEKGNPLTVKIEIDEDTPAGDYTLEFVYLDDAAGNRGNYGAGGAGAQPVPGEKPSFTVINDDYTVNDIKAELISFKLDGNTVTIPQGGEAKLKFNMEINASETWISSFSVTFRNEKNIKDQIHKQQKFGIDPNDFYFEMGRYTVPGTYKLDNITIETSGKNTVVYTEKSIETDPDDPYTYCTFPDGIDSENIKFTVTNPNFKPDDKKAPVLNSFKLENTVVDVTKDYQQVIMNYDVSDENSGVKGVFPIFKNKENGKETSVVWYDDNYPNLCYIPISPYEPAGVFDLMQVFVSDNMGNEAVYYAESNLEKPEDALTIEDMSFTVINNWKEPDKPVTPQAPQPTPSQPNGSTSSSASGGSVSSTKAASSSVSSSEKRAEQEYQFWQGLKTKVRKAADGKKIKVFIPKETTRMPASFMESIRTSKNNITVELHWNSKKMTITPETALKRSPRRVFWNLKTLVEQYHA